MVIVTMIEYNNLLCCIHSLYWKCLNSKLILQFCVIEFKNLSSILQLLVNLELSTLINSFYFTNKLKLYTGHEVIKLRF